MHEPVDLLGVDHEEVVETVESIVQKVQENDEVQKKTAYGSKVQSISTKLNLSKFSRVVKKADLGTKIPYNLKTGEFKCFDSIIEKDPVLKNSALNILGSSLAKSTVSNYEYIYRDFINFCDMKN